MGEHDAVDMTQYLITRLCDKLLTSFRFIKPVGYLISKLALPLDTMYPNQLIHY